MDGWLFIWGCCCLLSYSFSLCSGESLVTSSQLGAVPCFSFSLCHCRSPPSGFNPITLCTVMTLLWPLLLILINYILISPHFQDLIGSIWALSYEIYDFQIQSLTHTWLPLPRLAATWHDGSVHVLYMMLVSSTGMLKFWLISYESTFLWIDFLYCFSFSPHLPLASFSVQYQMEMMRSLRHVNIIDHLHVGWYQSTYYGSFVRWALLDSQFSYRHAIEESVVLIYG